MTFGAPQIIWIALVALGLGTQATKRKWPELVGHTLGQAAMASLLYWGGFFGG